MNDAIQTQIRRAIERAGISVNEAARRSDVPERSLRRILAGQSSGDTESLSRLAKGLGAKLIRPAVTYSPDGTVQ